MPSLIRSPFNGEPLTFYTRRRWGLWLKLWLHTTRKHKRWCQGLVKILSRAVDVETEVSVNYSKRSSFYGKALTLYMESREKPGLSLCLHLLKDEASGSTQMSGDWVFQKISDGRFISPKPPEWPKLENSRFLSQKSGQWAEFRAADFCS